jgi:putative flippase GtrA
MTLASRDSTGAKTTAGVIFAGFVFSLAANLPGHMSFDSVIQMVEGRTGAYAGWHPPVTSWLLGVLDSILPGTALFVVLNTLLIYGSLWLLMRRTRAPGWAAAAIAFAAAFTPQYLIYPGIVWKDILFSASAVAGFVALACASEAWPRVSVRYGWLGFAMLLLIVASLARQNGILLLLGGIAAFAWIAKLQEGFGWRDAALWGGVALAAAIVIFTAANVALGTRLTKEYGGARQFRLLQAYDIVAALAAKPGLPLDILDEQDPALSQAMRGDGARLYTPQRNDTLAASQPLQSALTAVPPATLRAQWFSLLLHHPLLYLSSRADMFGWVLFTPDVEKCLPFTVGVQGPQDELDQIDMDPRWDDRDDALQNYGNAFEGTPVFQHGVFALLSLIAAVLLLRRRRDLDIAIGMMQVSSLLYTASFFFISIACDYRYLYALDLAAVTGWFYLALDWHWPEERLRAFLSGPDERGA